MAMDHATNKDLSITKKLMTKEGGLEMQQKLMPKKSVIN